MIELAVFDMAGTTVDDGGRVYDALRQAVTETGASVAEGDLQTWMGADKVTAIDALMRLGGVEPIADAAQQQFGRFKEILHASYAATPPVEIGGAGRSLTELRARGIKVALTTGFDAAIVGPLLRGMNWAVVGTPEADAAAVVLDAVVTTDDVPEGRPAPYMVHRAMERTGVRDVAKVLVAGDTVVDIEAGRNSGGIACGVLTGKADRALLGTARFDHILDSVADILDLPETQPGQR